MGEITDSLLLGLEFLKAHNNIINLENYTLTVDKALIPITKIKTEGSKNGVEIYRVSLQKRTVIPPQSVKFIPVQIDKPFKDLLCVETDRNISNGFLPPNSVISVGQTKSSFRNPTDSFITLKRGKNVGFGMEIDELISMEDEEFFVNKIEIDKSAKIPSSDNLRSQLPLHMQDLYERSITNLDKKDHHEVFSLLNRFQHVFAKNDFDLGLFNGEITDKNTDEARPIKQKLRRTPMGFENEEKSYIDQMLEKGIVQPSISEWASPPVLVRKKMGK